MYGLGAWEAAASKGMSLEGFHIQGIPLFYDMFTAWLVRHRPFQSIQPRSPKLSQGKNKGSLFSGELTKQKGI